MKTALLLIASVLVTGCASIAGEKTQPIMVQTIHESRELVGVGCTLTNDAGTWFVTSPGSVSIHKSTGDLAIDCKHEDVFGNQTLVSKSNGAVWGNVLLGGGIGYIVDRNTGAGFDYPATVTVMMRRVSSPTPPAAPTAPAAAMPPVAASAPAPAVAAAQ